MQHHHHWWARKKIFYLRLLRKGLFEEEIARYPSYKLVSNWKRGQHICSVLISHKKEIDKTKKKKKCTQREEKGSNELSRYCFLFSPTDKVLISKTHNANNTNDVFDGQYLRLHWNPNNSFYINIYIYIYTCTFFLDSFFLRSRVYVDRKYI